MSFRTSCISVVVFAFAASSAIAADWSYDGDVTGQDDWGALSREYAACATGTSQSPIQIYETTAKKLPPLDIRYNAALSRVKLTRHGIVITPEGYQTLTDNDHLYKLQRIELHTPSEHTVKDRFYPLEIELLHADDKGKMLILSVFADFGGFNQMLQELGGHLPERGAPATEIRFDPSALLPKNRGYYAYTGSLTTPPCTEGVEWRLLKMPITLEKPQLAVLANSMKRNARMPQPIYLRTIYESE